ncbi:MAG: thioredoxin domain-containing protein [Alphaproteobacteria bacterium]|nr:thioredoxin domain-containing protein [Alphaproteobacteria bacterium]MDD9920408.1 thioredoxin domain-containing protein [Alphaproteobacteria bacterium]
MNKKTKKYTNYYFWLGLFSLTFALCAKANEESAEATAEEGAQVGNTASATVHTTPTITIGGVDIMDVVRGQQKEHKFEIPESLADGISQHYLKKRTRFTPYNHAPQRWNAEAKITVIEMADLGCLECMPTLQKVDEILKEHKDEIKFIHFYTPTTTSSAVQLAPFYGKIAQRSGGFWSYRRKLQGLTEANVDTYFNLLVNMGLDQTTVRRSAIRDSRHFYRELDADAQLAKRKKIKQSPTWLVNGIRVSEEGKESIPLEKLTDLIQYELSRIRYEEWQETKK